MYILHSFGPPQAKIFYPTSHSILFSSCIWPFSNENHPISSEKSQNWRFFKTDVFFLRFLKKVWVWMRNKKSIACGLTQYTSFSHNYVWRKKCGHLDPKSTKMWRILSTRSFRFWGHQSMHVLKKVWFWLKSHCTQDLKKVQNHQYRFHTVEKRFWFRSRSA